MAAETTKLNSGSDNFTVQTVEHRHSTVGLPLNLRLIHQSFQGWPCRQGSAQPRLRLAGVRPTHWCWSLHTRNFVIVPYISEAPGSIYCRAKLGLRRESSRAHNPRAVLLDCPRRALLAEYLRLNCQHPCPCCREGRNEGQRCMSLFMLAKKRGAPWRVRHRRVSSVNPTTRRP